MIVSLCKLQGKPIKFDEKQNGLRRVAIRSTYYKTSFSKNQQFQQKSKLDRWYLKNVFFIILNTNLIEQLQSIIYIVIHCYANIIYVR